MNKHDYAIGCEAFMKVKIGQDRWNQLKIVEKSLKSWKYVKTGENDQHYVKEVFWSKALKYEK